MSVFDLTGITAYEPEEIRRFLADTSTSSPFPELDTAKAKGVLSRPHAQAALAEARESLNEDVPGTPYSLFMEFSRTGARGPYQRAAFRKRELLAHAALVVWADEDNTHMDRLCDLIWNVCEETNWAVPAHADQGFDVDLFSTETAALLAHVSYMLVHQLPCEVVRRIHREIEIRVFKRFLESQPFYKFLMAVDNWTAVCVGSIGKAALLLQLDEGTRAKLVSSAILHMQRYLRDAFAKDGGCPEGLGYWQFGMAHCLGFSAMLRARTGGHIDLLSSPRLKEVGRFPLVMALDKDTCANFADCPPTVRLRPFVGAMLSEIMGDNTILSLVEPKTTWNLGDALRDMVLWDGTKPGTLDIRDEYLPELGVIKKTAEWPGVPVAFAAKGGHNSETHNHNDVGSFVLHVGRTTYISDPGAGLYGKADFTGTRYKMVFNGSHGHNVPLIGGQPQRFGPQFKGVLEPAPGQACRIDFHEAYGMPELKRLTRSLTLSDNESFVVEDTVEFEGDGQMVEELFMTWLPVEASGSMARITGPEGVLVVEAVGGTMEIDDFDEECRENERPDGLRRLRAAYPAAPQQAIRVIMRLEPAS